MGWEIGVVCLFAPLVNNAGWFSNENHGTINKAMGRAALLCFGSCVRHGQLFFFFCPVPSQPVGWLWLWPSWSAPILSIHLSLSHSLCLALNGCFIDLFIHPIGSRWKKVLLLFSFVLLVWFRNGKDWFFSWPLAVKLRPNNCELVVCCQWKGLMDQLFWLPLNRTTFRHGQLDRNIFNLMIVWRGDLNSFISGPEWTGPRVRASHDRHFFFKIWLGCWI